MRRGNEWSIERCPPRLSCRNALFSVTIRLMTTEQIVGLLVAERDRLNRAIEALQGPVKRRGRPPKNQLAVVASAPAPMNTRKRRTAAQRKAQSDKMKKYWALRKKQAKG
jgi:hypothetical protein